VIQTQRKALQHDARRGEVPRLLFDMTGYTKAIFRRCSSAVISNFTAVNSITAKGAHLSENKPGISINLPT
jgi:hypothetical protein